MLHRIGMDVIVNGGMMNHHDSNSSWFHIRGSAYLKHLEVFRKFTRLCLIGRSIDASKPTWVTVFVVPPLFEDYSSFKCTVTLRQCMAYDLQSPFFHL
jgi:hypothetical protein